MSVEALHSQDLFTDLASRSHLDILMFQESGGRLDKRCQMPEE